MFESNQKLFTSTEYNDLYESIIFRVFHNSNVRLKVIDNVDAIKQKEFKLLKKKPHVWLICLEEIEG